MRLTDAQIAEQTTKLATILKYIHKLDEVDIEGVEPMAHAQELQNVLRADQEVEGLATEAILKNAPDRDGGLFKVPKVLGEGSS